MRLSPVPASVRDLAFEANGLPGPGWHRDSVPRLLHALAGSIVAAVRITVHLRVPWGFGPTRHAWACVRQQGELALAFAERSRREAGAYVAGLWSGDIMAVQTERAVPVTAGPQDVAFVVTLDAQDAAHSMTATRSGE